MTMKTYNVSKAAEELGVNRRTLQRWSKDQKIPPPTPGIMEGRLAKFWTEKEMDLIKEYMQNEGSGKGIDRRTGKKAKLKKE